MFNTVKKVLREKSLHQVLRCHGCHSHCSTRKGCSQGGFDTHQMWKHACGEWVSDTQGDCCQSVDEVKEISHGSHLLTCIDMVFLCVKHILCNKHVFQHLKKSKKSESIKQNSEKSESIKCEFHSHEVWWFEKICICKEVLWTSIWQQTSGCWNLQILQKHEWQWLHPSCQGIRLGSVFTKNHNFGSTSLQTEFPACAKNVRWFLVNSTQKNSSVSIRNSPHVPEIVNVRRCLVLEC